MKSLLIATHNQGKLKEISQLLAPIEVLGQASLNITAAEETGLTFVENALLKARHASEHANLAALGDDSGLVVPSLQGAPGIYSSRYAGLHASDEDNITQLLHALKDSPDSQREAFFYCVLVLIRYPQDPMPIICSGFIKGVISHSRQGLSGFGYDPIFYLPKLKRSMAELSSTEKNRVSHRGIALQQLTARLANEF